MIRKLFSLTALMLLLASCTTAIDNVENLRQRTGADSNLPVFFATIEGSDDAATKVFADDQLRVLWNADDRITVFNKYTYGYEYSFTGQDGDNAGEFTAIPNNNIVTGNPLDHVYALYPHSSSTKISNDGVITATLPSQQAYKANSFGIGANTMMSVTDDTHLRFKNVGGYLSFKFYGNNVSVKRITLKGNNGEKLAGKASITMTVGGTPTVEMQEDATQSITLICETPVVLGADADHYTEFWFVVPPTTFTQGFTVTVTDNQGGTFEKSTSGTVTISRSNLSRMSPMEVICVTNNIPPDDEIWYTTVDESIATIGPPNFGGVDAEHFNVHVISNTYENGKGIIKFDGPLTLIQGSIFQNDDQGQPTGRKVTRLMLPETVETIWDAAFYGMGITEFRVPSALQRMGRAALEGPNISRVYGKHASSDERCIVIDGVLYYFAPYGVEKYTLPNEIKEIKEAVFQNSDLSSITLNEGLEIIRDDAFYGTHIKSVVLPNSLITVSSWAFRGCFELEGFYGNPDFHSDDNLCLFTNEFYPYWEKTLGMFVGRNVEEYSIPEGVTFIQARAFEELPNLREVTFPNSLTDCSFEVFYKCSNLDRINGKFSTEDHRGIVVGDTYKSFAARHNVKEVHIPDHVTRIAQEAFREADEVEKITMGDNVTDIDAFAFCFCYNLKSITFSANLQRFNGSYILLASTDELEEIYFRSIIPPYFKETDNIYDNLPKLTVYVPRSSLDLYLENEGLSHFRSKMQPYDYSDLPTPDFYVSTDFSADGAITTLQQSTTGVGIDLILMGDAFSDRQIADGTYGNVMQKAMNAFFSEEPYKTMKNCFNVYQVDVVSATEGYEHSGQALSTGHGDGTYVFGNDTKVINYAMNAVGEDRMDDALVIVMMNEDAYAGTCFMYYPDSGDYGRGLSIAYFPTSSDTDTFNGLVSHEAGGHGFAKLADEYAYEYMGAISANVIVNRKAMEPYGWWKNIDFTSDPAQVKWSHFIADDRYDGQGIGCIEGGLTYWTGVWRPTDYSIMRYNTGGFNAPSREAIWYRIHKLAYGENWQYNYEDFVTYDAINRTVVNQAPKPDYVARQLPKPTPPVIIGHSWREALDRK